MIRKGKRGLALLLVFVLCMNLSSIVSQAADSQEEIYKCGENLVCTFSKAWGSYLKLNISGTGEMWDYSSSKKETRAPWLGGGRSGYIYAVEIGEGVTSIGSYAFYNCYKLSSVVISEGVKRIGRGAFSGCLRLKSVTIPKSVTAIESGAFGGVANDEYCFIYYAGSEEEWNRIGGGNYNNTTIIFADSEEDAPTESDSFYFSEYDNKYCIVGTTGGLFSHLTNGDINRIGDEDLSDTIDSAVWTSSDPSVLEVTGTTCIEEAGGLRAGWGLEVAAYKPGVVSITGTTSDGRAAVLEGISVEPEMVIEGTSSITEPTTITCRVQIEEKNAAYLEQFISGLSYSFESGQGTVNVNSSSYSVSDDALSAIYTLQVTPASLGDLDVVFVSSAGQKVKKSVSVKELGTLVDSDKDGLPDEWEINGVDVDGDGNVDIDLPAMGADPNKPDLFVEIDWMYQPYQVKEERYLWGSIIHVYTQEEIDLSPSENALKLVYEQFQSHGINLHLDAGPDSMDFVTGKKWGNLSGGNTLEYQENFNLGNSGENWNQLASDNFSANRVNIFRYCIFLNRFNNSFNSGIACDIPGQYFIVAEAKGTKGFRYYNGVSSGGDVAIAGTFMHELGHTLGLCHGGITSLVKDHTNYKPNYISVMNYLFQMSGLYGTNEINYSDFCLPSLDETNLDEHCGVDPYSVTAGTGLGTLLYGKGGLKINNIAGKAIDFNQNGSIETGVSVDLNNDGETEKLAEVESDWWHITYRGGSIGDYGDSLKNIVNIAISEQSEMLNELTIPDAIENGLMKDTCKCTIEKILPQTLYSGLNDQELSVFINNPFADEIDATLNIESEMIDQSISKKITIAGRNSQNYITEIKIPVENSFVAGEYNLKCTLVCENGTTDIFEIIIPIVEMETIELQVGENKQLIPTGVLDGLDCTVKSSDVSIATIKDGIVTAKTVGQTYISVTVESGEKSVCSVNVVGLENAHNWELEYTIDEKPTCIENGSQSIHCTDCNITKDAMIIPATGHSFDDWEISSAPTCVDRGSKSHTCTACDYTETQEMDTVDHDWDKSYTVDKVPTSIKNGSKSIHCKNCDAVKDVEVIPAKDTVNYQILYGSNSRWQKGSSLDLSFHTDGEAAFISVRVNGIQIDSDNYTVQSDGTIITLNASYLETLEIGTHMLTVEYNDGKATAQFTIIMTDNDDVSLDNNSSAETGDNSLFWLWMIMVLISWAGLMGTAFIHKDTKNKR